MELRNLKTFIRAAELGSFSKAAERLNYAQSTVTAQMEALEKELGVRLFVRNGKRISLSAAGKELLRYAYQARALEDEIHSYFTKGGEPVGEIHLGILESIDASGYMSAVGDFLEKYREVRLKVTVGTTIGLTDMLKKGEVDAVVLLDRPVMDPAFLRLYQKTARVVFFSRAGKFAAESPVTLEELMGERWLLTEKGCNYRKLLEDEASERKLHLKDCLEIGSTKTLIRFAARGLGISLLPEFDLLSGLESGEIEVIPVEDCRMEMEVQILVSNERWLPPPVRLLCGEIAAAFEAGLS